jgi:hypothetical protein
MREINPKFIVKIGAISSIDENIFENMKYTGNRKYPSTLISEAPI